MAFHDQIKQDEQLLIFHQPIPKFIREVVKAAPPKSQISFPFSFFIFSTSVLILLFYLMSLRLYLPDVVEKNILFQVWESRRPHYHP